MPYIPLVIFALLMFIIIAREFLKETWFDRLLIVLTAIIGVAIALFLGFLHVITHGGPSVLNEIEKALHGLSQHAPVLKLLQGGFAFIWG